MIGFDIRNMTVGDVPAAVAIIASHEEVDGAQSKAYFESYFVRAETSVLRREQLLVGVDEESGVIAGVVGIAPDKYDWPDVIWITWLYVAQNYRRRGLGWRLLNRVADDARELGARKLYLDTSSYISYQPAIQMYERFGFREEGRLLDYYDAGEHLLILGVAL